MVEFESPLKKWPGSFLLPDYDDFSGEMWDIYRQAMEATGDDTLNRKFCYAGLSLIDKVGEWCLEIELAEMQKWAKDKKAERTRLVSWVGKSVGDYIDELIDPKGLA